MKVMEANIALAALDPGSMSPPLNITIVDDEGKLSLLETYLNKVQGTGWDVETPPVDSFSRRKLRTLQFGDRNEQFVIDLLKFCPNPEDLDAQQGNYGARLTSLAPIRDMLRPFLERVEFEKVGYNLQFEYVTLRWNWGIKSTGFFDLLIAEKMIQAGIVHYMLTGYWSMDDMVARYLKLHVDKSYQKTFFLDTPLSAEQAQYCALDVRLPIAMQPALMQQLMRGGLQIAADLEMKAISAFGEMYLTGMPINHGRWETRIKKEQGQLRTCIDRLDDFFLPLAGSKHLSEEEKDLLLSLESLWRNCSKKDSEGRAAYRAQYMDLQKLETKRKKLSGECEGKALLNYGSKAQLRAGLIKLGYKASQLPNTADETLAKLSKNKIIHVKPTFEADPTLASVAVIDVIRLYRSLSKSIDSYGYQWITDYDHLVHCKTKPKPGHINPDTGCIHSDIFQLGASTGRTSSTDPNSQNIPKDQEYRSPFAAPAGYSIVTLDFNGCELRILAELSQDPVWLEAFRNDWDLHSIIAELVYGEQWRAAALPGCAYYAAKKKCECPIHKELRDKRVKIINFSIAYGKSAFGLAEDMGIPREEAEDILARWRKANPVVAAYLDKAGKSAATKFVAYTLSGRYRKWPMPNWESAQRLAIKDAKAGVVVTQDMVKRKLKSMFASIDREGKNASIQGTNADVAKLAMYYIWLGGDEFDIKQINFVHDENVLLVPTEKAEAAAKFASDCMERAGAAFVKSIRMTAEYKIADCWKK